MLDRDTRTAILRLQREGHGARTIAKTLGVSRGTVRKVLRSGEADVPKLSRATRLDAHLDLIRGLHELCKGNLVRVHEVLETRGVESSYPALTRFCREHGVGVTPKVPVGRYTFEPAEEMQHDTSPHIVEIGGRMQKVECASLVLCFSRYLFAQVYERWTRFECRVFLTEALRFMQGAAGDCMLDNSTVIITVGTGRDALAAPEMQAFAKRFGFRFIAHTVGDKDRSARVERPFHHIENNFYPGRTFTDIADLNRQLAEWCNRINRKPKRSLGCTPLELYAIERPRLRPLPLHIPEVYEVHQRRVDTEGYVNLHTNRYSAPARTIGRQVQARETAQLVRLFDGHELLAEHDKRPAGARRRCLLDAHKVKRPRKRDRRHTPQERELRNASPTLDRLVDALRKRHGGRAIRAMKQLHAMWLEYPTEPLVQAIEEALHYGLLDLGRIDSMVLARIRGDFFRLSADDSPPASNEANTYAQTRQTARTQDQDDEEDQGRS